MGAGGTELGRQPTGFQAPEEDLASLVEHDGQSAAAPSPFPPIGDYAFLSDCHTGALVALDGSVDWLCVPRFDSPSIFGSLLDRQAGSFRFAPFGITFPAARQYEPGTNVLATTWKTPGGWLLIRDALVIGERLREDTITPHTRPPTDDDAKHLLVRLAICLEGAVELELVCEPRFDYGRSEAEWSLLDGGRAVAIAEGAGSRVALRSDLSLGIEGSRARARHVLRQGEQAYCSLSWGEELWAEEPLSPGARNSPGTGAPRSPGTSLPGTSLPGTSPSSGTLDPETIDQANAWMAATSRFWRGWLARARIPDHRFSEVIQRSALTIKGLTYMPTGATVAALTTSLPETPGGERNWDYRYTWMRDASFTLRALHLLNLDWEAEEFMQFVADLEPNEDGALQIMYGVDGRRDLAESTRDDLSGYAGARPVRVGNGAFDQRQNDVYGAVLDAILLRVRRSQRLPQRLWPVICAQAECASRAWREPDQGIWEARGEPRHYVSSKLMSWVALDRAATLAEIRGDPALASEWHATAREIHSDICDHGFDSRGVLVQHYETDALDAAALLAALFGFLPGHDPRLCGTVLAIAEELTEDGLVLRYRTDETDDGLAGREGTFLICSFWLASALQMIGEHQQATDLLERLLREASPLGLYAEELDTATGRHLGNFPQAFSHLALLDATARIILHERLAELSGSDWAGQGGER